jgi:hypothetical protein
MILLALVVTSLVFVTGSNSYACSNPDAEPTDITQVVVYCSESGAQLRHEIATAATGVEYRLVAGCQEMPPMPGETCLNPRECVVPLNSYLYWIERSNNAGKSWFWHARTCLSDEEKASLQTITWQQVWREMKKLSWPQADLVIQPPGGRTLVNFPTNFMTTTTTPTSQTVTLLGVDVEIEATPVAFTWHFGDGETHEGSDPGAAYPDLRITHVYRHAGVTVEPSVDVTYRGAYRVDDGPWQDIPDTLTVVGAPVGLEVVSATPHLVG